MANSREDINQRIFEMRQERARQEVRVQRGASFPIRPEFETPMDRDEINNKMFEMMMKRAPRQGNEDRGDKQQPADVSVNQQKRPLR